MRFYDKLKKEEVHFSRVIITIRNGKTIYKDKSTMKEIVDEEGNPLEPIEEEFKGYSTNVIGSYQNRREKHLKFVKERAKKASQTTEAQDMKKFFEKRETKNLTGKD